MDNSFELDSGILMNPKVWEASGHIESFDDPLLDCKECKVRFRADNLIQKYDSKINADLLNEEEMMEIIKVKKIPCPNCGKSNFTGIRQFNLMFSTKRGVTQKNGTNIFLRPENAQGEYINFLNVLRAMRTKLPFGIGQIGKAFRNEITPGNFTFRTIEFEQMEYQTFCKKGEDEKIYENYKNLGIEFLKFLGIDENKLRFANHEKLAHYAKAACDIEYLFPFGWGEINGTHNRTDFDLKRHQEFSGKNITYTDEQTKERYIPYVVESTYGLDRIFLAILFETLCEESLPEGKTRKVLKLKPMLAPIKVNVLPLIKKQHSGKAKEVYSLLKRNFMTSYNESGSIGKRYRRGDLIGTPFAITIDDNTIINNIVTLRERDSMAQIELNIDEVVQYVKNKIEK